MKNLFIRLNSQSFINREMVDASNTLSMLGYHKAKFVFKGRIGIPSIESPSYKDLDTLFNETWGKCIWVDGNEFIWKIEIKKMGWRHYKILYHSIFSTKPTESKEGFSSVKLAIEFLS